MGYATTDASIGFGKETTYGTPVVPNRHFEFVSESLKHKKTTHQGKGLRVGSRVDRSNRRRTTQVSADGDITCEVTSRGMGAMLEAAFGAATSTMVETGCYQQVFTLGDARPSYTLQKGLVAVGLDGTMSMQALTMPGSQVDSFEFDQKANDVPTLKTTWQGREVLTSTAYTPPVYPASGTLFSFVDATLLMGTFQPATATALASVSASSQVGTASSFSVAMKASLSDRFYFGGQGRRATGTPGRPDLTVKVDVDFADLTFVNAILTDQPITLLATWSTGVQLGATTTEILQVAVPCWKIDTDTPVSNAGAIIKQSLSGKGLDDLTNTSIQVVLRTADTAL